VVTSESVRGVTNRLTGKVEDLEEHDMPVADFTLEDMKKARVKLRTRYSTCCGPFGPDRNTRLDLPAAGPPSRLVFLVLRLHRRFLPYFALYLQSIGFLRPHRGADVARAVSCVCCAVTVELAGRQAGPRVRIVVASTAAALASFSVVF